jgi:hypothetical protein
LLDLGGGEPECLWRQGDILKKEHPMSKPKNRVAPILALLFTLPFAAGSVHAAMPVDAGEQPAEQMGESPLGKPLPAPPTIDSDKDGKADAWDRDADGVADAWDVNGDAKPDLFDDNGDGKPDSDPASPAPMEDEAQPPKR